MKLLFKLISLRFKLWLLLLCKDQEQKLTQDLSKLSSFDEPKANHAVGYTFQNERLFLERLRTGVMVALFISLWVMFFINSNPSVLRPDSFPVSSPSLHPHFQPRFDT